MSLVNGPTVIQEPLAELHSGFYLLDILSASIRGGRTWAIAVRRGSYESLFLPNSGRFSLEK